MAYFRMFLLCIFMAKLFLSEQAFAIPRAKSLLYLSKMNIKDLSNNRIALSPSPSPSASPHRNHTVHHFGQRVPGQPSKREKRKKQRRTKRTLLISLLSCSSSALLILALGIIWVLRRKVKQRKRKVMVHSNMGSDPCISHEIDMMYIDTLGWELDTAKQQNTSPFGSSGAENVPNKNLAETSPLNDTSDDDTFHSLLEEDSLSSAPRSSNASSVDAPKSFPSPLFDPSDRMTTVPPPPPPPPLPRGTIFSKGTQQRRLLTHQNWKESNKSVPDSNGKIGEAIPLPFGRLSLERKEGVSLPKLKPLHWDKVRAAPNRTMVWDQIRCNSFEIDEETIGSLFGYNGQTSKIHDDAKSKSASPGKQVLDQKRLQNITILLKAVNLSSDQVCHALNRGKGLTQTQLEALARVAPTKEEEEMLMRFRVDYDDFGPTEKFMRTLLGIPAAFSRLELMLFKETFEDEVVHLRNSFSMLEEACNELKSSRLFLKLLEAVLKTGNRMNVGTIRGGAKAFKLDALLNLADIKGTDGKTTLLHFVVQETIRSEGARVSESIVGKIHQKSNDGVEEKEEENKRMGLDLVAGLSSELHNVKKTATVDLQLLKSSIINISEGIAKLKGLSNGEMIIDDEKNERFETTMRIFSGYAERALRDLRDDESRISVKIAEVSEFFHGNNGWKVEDPLRIFVIVRDFLGMLDHVCKTIRNSKSHHPKSYSIIM